MNICLLLSIHYLTMFFGMARGKVEPRQLSLPNMFMPVVTVDVNAPESNFQVALNSLLGRTPASTVTLIFTQTSSVTVSVGSLSTTTVSNGPTLTTTVTQVSTTTISAQQQAITSTETSTTTVTSVSTTTVTSSGPDSPVTSTVTTTVTSTVSSSCPSFVTTTQTSTSVASVTCTVSATSACANEGARAGRGAFLHFLSHDQHHFIHQPSEVKQIEVTAVETVGVESGKEAGELQSSQLQPSFYFDSPQNRLHRSFNFPDEKTNRHPRSFSSHKSSSTGLILHPYLLKLSYLYSRASSSSKSSNLVRQGGQTVSTVVVTECTFSLVTVSSSPTCSTQSPFLQCAAS